MSGKSIYEQMAKKMLLAKSYGMGAAAMRIAYGSREPRWADMKCIGGKVTVIGSKFVKQQKLFFARGKVDGLVYVKTARQGFCPLCNDNTLSNGRKWSELELPETHRRTDTPSEGGHVTVQDILEATKVRIGVAPQVSTTTDRWNIQR